MSDQDPLGLLTQDSDPLGLLSDTSKKKEPTASPAPSTGSGTSAASASESTSSDWVGGAGSAGRDWSVSNTPKPTVFKVENPGVNVGLGLDEFGRPINAKSTGETKTPDQFPVSNRGLNEIADQMYSGAMDRRDNFIKEDGTVNWNTSGAFADTYLKRVVNKDGNEISPAEKQAVRERFFNRLQSTKVSEDAFGKAAASSGILKYIDAKTPSDLAAKMKEMNAEGSLLMDKVNKNVANDWDATQTSILNNINAKFAPEIAWNKFNSEIQADSLQAVIQSSVDKYVRAAYQQKQQEMQAVVNSGAMTADQANAVLQSDAMKKQLYEAANTAANNEHADAIKRYEADATQRTNELNQRIIKEHNAAREAAAQYFNAKYKEATNAIVKKYSIPQDVADKFQADYNKNINDVYAQNQLVRSTVEGHDPSSIGRAAISGITATFGNMASWLGKSMIDNNPDLAEGFYMGSRKLQQAALALSPDYEALKQVNGFWKTTLSPNYIANQIGQQAPIMAAMMAPGAIGAIAGAGLADLASVNAFWGNVLQTTGSGVAAWMTGTQMNAADSYNKVLATKGPDDAKRAYDDVWKFSLSTLPTYMIEAVPFFKKMPLWASYATEQIMEPIQEHMENMTQNLAENRNGDYNTKKVMDAISAYLGTPEFNATTAATVITSLGYSGMAHLFTHPNLTYEKSKMLDTFARWGRVESEASIQLGLRLKKITEAQAAEMRTKLDDMQAAINYAGEVEGVTPLLQHAIADKQYEINRAKREITADMDPERLADAEAKIAAMKKESAALESGKTGVYALTKPGFGPMFMSKEAMLNNLESKSFRNDYINEKFGVNIHNDNSTLNKFNETMLAHHGEMVASAKQAAATAAKPKSEQIKEALKAVESAPDFQGDLHQTNPLRIIPEDVGNSMDHITEDKAGLTPADIQQAHQWMFNTFDDLMKNQAITDAERKYSLDVLNNLNDAIWQYNDKHLNKEQNDSQNQTGVSGQEREGEKPVEANPVGGAGEKTSGNGGVVQKAQEVTPPAPAKKSLKEILQEEPAEEHTVESIKKIDTSNLSRIQKKVLGDAKHVLSAISKAVPGAKVVMHWTNKSFVNSVNKYASHGNKLTETESASGTYVGSDGAIHLNMEHLDSNTMFHEGAHPLFDVLSQKDPDKINDLYEQLKGMKGFRGVEEFSKQYSGIQQKKEAIIEWIARVADGDFKVSTTNLEKVKEIIKSVLNSIGWKSMADRIYAADKKELIKLANTISSAFKTGAPVEPVGRPVKGDGAEHKGKNVFSSLEDASDLSENAKSIKVQAKNSKKAEAIRSGMTKTQLFVEDNYEEIAKQLKKDKILDAPCL